MQIFRCAPRRVPLVVGSFAVIGLLVASLSMPLPASGVPAAKPESSSQPDFGPNVFIFTPDMPQSEIQAKVDSVAAQQVSNQFGTQRYALLFAPGTYGSSASPLNFQVGYYTAVAGLGLSPNDVVINGSIYVRNQCFGAGNCIALDEFLAIVVEFDHQRNDPGVRLLQRRILGSLAGRADAPGACHRVRHASWTIAPLRRSRVEGSSLIRSSTAVPS